MTTIRLQLGRKGVMAGSLIGLMVVLVIGIAVTYSVVQSTSTRSTTIYSMANDTFNASTTTGNRTLFRGFNDGSSFVIDISTMHLYNGTACSAGEYTYTTDYVVLGNGTAPYLNLTGTGSSKRAGLNYTCAVYNYYDSTYIPGAISRGIISLLPLLVVVALLAATASMIA